MRQNAVRKTNFLINCFDLVMKIKFGFVAFKVFS